MELAEEHLAPQHIGQCIGVRRAVGGYVGFLPQERPLVLQDDAGAMQQRQRIGGYDTVWTIKGGKDVITGSLSDRDWHGRQEINGAARLHDGKLTTEITSWFVVREPERERLA